MSYVLDIATAVPAYTIEKEDLERFYTDVMNARNNAYFLKKLRFVNQRTSISRRHSCIPDYRGREFELYKSGNYTATVEDRMSLYKQKIVLFAASAIDKLMNRGFNIGQVTHLITVSCTGQCAPGIEFMIAEHYNISWVEKQAINFLGCYAAVRALKHAHYVATADPSSCILIVSAELCSLHFYPSFEDEEMIANLLFSDGAAAVLMCGKNNKLAEGRKVLQVERPGSAVIPGTSGLMTWNLSSSAFRMFLSTDVVTAIRENVRKAFAQLLGDGETNVTHWAIHPGGVKIVEAVQRAMDLQDSDVAVSMSILKDYGNMSSATILFILEKMFSEIRETGMHEQKLFACAFGPGINVEMISFKAREINASHPGEYVQATQA